MAHIAAMSRSIIMISLLWVLATLSVVAAVHTHHHYTYRADPLQPLELGQSSDYANSNNSTVPSGVTTVHTHHHHTHQGQTGQQPRELPSERDVDYVNPHNSARQAQGAGIPDLSWDTELASYATRWAQHQATEDDCNMVHSKGPHGENIFWSSTTSTPAEAVEAWVDEKQYYDYASNKCRPGQMCGHYTQVVWKNTQRVGCGSARCADGGTFVVCSYDPPGNYIGQRPY